MNTLIDQSGKAKLYIGTDIDGQKVYIDIELKYKTGTYTTIDHKEIKNPLVLSISGYARLKSRKDWAYGGQIQDHLTPDNIKQYAIDRYTVDKLVTIWKHWHLNDMQGACIHQEEGAHVEPNTNIWREREAWDTMIKEQTAKCPEGYSYGSAWLIKPLPSRVIAEIHQLMRLQEATA